MAKLQAPASAGFNAGRRGDVKYFPLKDIIIDPEIAGLFSISEKVLKEIQEKIEKSGYNDEEPVVLWKGKNILVDGRTRYTASKNLGLEKIPVFEKEFEDRDAALLYTFERQAIRRNLTGADILAAAQMIKGRKENNDGTGRSAELLADKLGISSSTVYQSRALLKEADPEDLEAVKKGEKSIKKAYTEMRKRQKPEREFFVNGAQSLPDNVKFLRASVVLLSEYLSANEALEEGPGLEQAINLLLNHFLKKNEKTGFFKLLPVEISKKLDCYTGIANSPQRQDKEGIYVSP